MPPGDSLRNRLLLRPSAGPRRVRGEESRAARQGRRGMRRGGWAAAVDQETQAAAAECALQCRDKQASEAKS